MATLKQIATLALSRRRAIVPFAIAVPTSSLLAAVLLAATSAVDDTTRVFPLHELVTIFDVHSFVAAGAFPAKHAFVDFRVDSAELENRRDVILPGHSQIEDLRERFNG